jgi:cystathionine beta-lyase
MSTSESRTRRDTVLVTAGVEAAKHDGAVNPAVVRASTVAFRTLAAFEQAAQDRFSNFYYGRFGTPTTFAFEEAVAELEGAVRTIAVPSGHAAFSAVFLALLHPGDHLLVTDCVYGPVRALCDGLLRRLGIETTYFDPRVGAGIASLIRANTRLAYLESPGSLTLEVQDLAPIVAACHAHHVLVALDNTWATPYLCRPLEHGVDISILSATKYIAGHSDCLIGTISTGDESLARRMFQGAVDIGSCVAPDVCYLALRGMRTLSVRLARQSRTALRLAEELAQRPEVAEVYHPGLASSPDHETFCKYFDGPSGLFSIRLPKVSKPQLANMLDHLRHFFIGASFGGFESLVLPVWPSHLRTARPWRHEGPLVRFSIGLEDYEDLREDLFAGLDRLGLA